MEQFQYHNLDQSLTLLQRYEVNRESLNSKIHYPPNVVQLNASIPQQFVSSLIHKGKEIKVHVVDVGNPSQFWITLKPGYLDASDLMYYIQKVYFNQNQSKELNISEEDVTQGMFCVALYEGEYNRGLVKQVIAEERKAVVFFVDYGTVSLIDSNKLYFLLEKFSCLPQQAIRAKLGGVRPFGKEWSNEAVQTFSSLVGMFKELTARIVRIDRTKKILKVILIDDQNGESVGDALVEKNFAYVEEDLSDVQPKGKSQIQLPNFSSQNGERFKVALGENLSCKSRTEFQFPPGVAEPRETISKQFVPKDTINEDEIQFCVGEIVNPSNFWLISNDGFENLMVLLDKLHEAYIEKPATMVIPEKQLKRGMYCVALYEGEFGRAVIRRVMMEEHQAEVCFVDFGTISLLDSRELLFILKEFMELPAQAVKARLFGIRPLETVWSADATKNFSRMVSEYKVVTAKLMDIDWYKRVLDVTLVDNSNGVCINTALVESNFALNETFHEPASVYKSVNGMRNPSPKLSTIHEE